MARPDKASSVAELTDHFRSANAAVLTEYRGRTDAQLKTLRRTRGYTGTYAVVKNTLTKIAAKEAGVTGVDDLLAGPSAIAFVRGDAVDAAKVIRNFAKENPALVIKGGYMDGAALSAADINKIADLESREVLLSKLAGVMKAKQSQAAALFAAPLAKTARALGALQTKLEADPAQSTPVDASAAAAPVEETEAPVAEAPEAPEAPVAEGIDVEAPAETAPDTETQAVEETTEG